MLESWLIGDKEIVARLEAMPEKLSQGLLRAVTALTLELEGLVKEKLSGEVLKVRSGTLRGSVHAEMEQGPDWVSGIGTKVPYAAINEYGGTIAPHLILPKKGRMLAFSWQGKNCVMAKVNHPGSKIPERSFLRSAMRELEPKIREQLAGAAREATNQ